MSALPALAGALHADEFPVVQHALASGDAPTIARSLQTVLALQRRVLEHGDTIAPWWAELGWQTIDRLTDAMIDAIPADPRRAARRSSRSPIGSGL